jgi:hypothetical protein
VLVVVDGEARLARFAKPEEGDEAELRFLGVLTGAQYTETVSIDENEEAVLKVKFEHPELPSGVLELEANGLRAIEKLSELRAVLRRWASAHKD